MHPSSFQQKIIPILLTVWFLTSCGPAATTPAQEEEIPSQAPATSQPAESPTTAPTPVGTSLTGIVIDGNGSDWLGYDVIGEDPAGDQVAGTPDLAEVRAFSNDRFFYLLIVQYEDGDTDHYDILMDVDGGDYDYQISVWPEMDQILFAAFPVTGDMLPIEDTTAAQGEVIEVKIPLSAIGDQPVQGIYVQAFLGYGTGDTMEAPQTQIVDEVEPQAVAEATATPPQAAVNATTSGLIKQDETWHGKIHITGDIWLADGVTLTIEPGTTVYLASNSDDQHEGGGFDDEYTRGHNDPVRLEEWDRNAIRIDGRGGIIRAIGTAEEPITFRPEGDSTSPAQWDGIYIERGTLQHAIVLYGGRTAVQILGSSDGVEIAHNEVRYFHWAGIDAHTENVWIHHNIVEGGGHQGLGVRSDTLAEYNIVLNAQTGIGIENAQGAVIRNNIVLDSAVGISIRDGVTCEVTNNTVLRVDGPPDGWYYQGEIVYPLGAAGLGGIDSHINGPFSILNNIVFGPFLWGLGIHTVPETGTQVDYNLVWGANDFYAGPGQSAAGANNFNADPSFVDVAGGDFHLSPVSPAVDTGAPEVLDPDGTRSDLGAYGGPGGDGW
jgi:parallel beta-helix repeat protein